jgi:CRP-like cAMP-binding protein
MPYTVPEDNTTARNLLLKRMSKEDYQLLRPALTPVELSVRLDIETPNAQVTHAHFPEHGIISVVAMGRKSRGVEVGLIGCDGMSGVSIVTGAKRSANHTYVQMEGRGVQVAASALEKILDQSPSLRSLLLRYVQTFMNQITGTALSNGIDKLEQRLARWLLMVRDRHNSDGLPLTHEFIAIMLGTRRPGVTTALNDLEYRGIIKARRKEILILDRKALEKFAGEAYGTAETEFKRVLRT